VFGSDISYSPLIDDMRKEGAVIYIGHNANNLKNLQNPIVIYSQAVKSIAPNH